VQGLRNICDDTAFCVLLTYYSTLKRAHGFVPIAGYYLIWNVRIRGSLCELMTLLRPKIFIRWELHGQ